MPTTRDQEEQDLRIEQMAVNIEKMRADMRWEGRRFLMWLLIAAAAFLAVGVAIGPLIAFHR